MSQKKVGDSLLQAASTVLEQVSDVLPPPNRAIDWSRLNAAFWQPHLFGGRLTGRSQLSGITLDNLLAVEQQKATLELNTRQFLAGLPANNALLWGVRGSGKSSLVHALLNRYASEGLRVVQVSKEDATSLFKITDSVKDQPYKFILYYDDLSFESSDDSYRALKSALEGSIFSVASNLLIYATSNRRHLLPETMEDNQNTRVNRYEIHPTEAVEEKVSLSERFGLWLSFRAFRQEDYLAIVEHWVTVLARKLPKEFDAEARQEALRWALQRGSRSGRVAWHFARHWVGRHRLQAASG